LIVSVSPMFKYTSGKLIFCQRLVSASWIVQSGSLYKSLIALTRPKSLKPLSGGCVRWRFPFRKMASR
jgi:hypothetical protein